MNIDGLVPWSLDWLWSLPLKRRHGCDPCTRTQPDPNSVPCHARTGHRANVVAHRRVADGWHDLVDYHFARLRSRNLG